MNEAAQSVIDDIQAAIDNRPSGWRKGQAAFNRLHELSPGWANAIRATHVDPFHNDDVLPKFFAWLPTIVEEPT